MVAAAAAAPAALAAAVAAAAAAAVAGAPVLAAQADWKQSLARNAYLVRFSVASILPRTLALFI